MVAIGFGMCGSGRNGRTPGSATVGYGKFREQRGATRSRGRNRLPFGDQESIRRDAQCGVMAEATPPAPFKMPQPDLLLEFLIIALDAPAQLDGVDQIAERDVFSARSTANILLALSRPRATRSAATRQLLGTVVA
jgi:hypothetical protein